MRLKHMGSKCWLAPHMDRLLGDVALLRLWKAGVLPHRPAARKPGMGKIKVFPTPEYSSKQPPDPVVPQQIRQNRDQPGAVSRRVQENLHI